MKLENFIEIGSGFYNLKTPFVLGAVFDIGNQMSLLRLQSTGRYIVIDTCSLTPGAKAELDFLTDGGKLIDAVVASHPYHTMFFVPFHKMYPTLKYYGTPRHIRTIPTIQWTGDVSTEAVQTLWSPEIEMRIPEGAEFDGAADNNHFSSVFVLHVESKTIHDDDTLMYFEPKHMSCGLRVLGAKSDQLSFHTSFLSGGIKKEEGAMKAFKEWLNRMLAEWDFENICTAHYGNLLGGAKKLLLATIEHHEKKGVM